MMRAMTEVAAGHRDAAATLQPVSEDPMSVGGSPALLPHTHIEVLLLRAAVALDIGDDPAARAALGAAVALGRSLDVVRPFVLAAPAVRTEVARLYVRAGADPFAARVTAALAALQPEVAVALSERETAVLTLLPSLLSAREIAGELSVSLNTVKTHIRSIYAKLGVSRRRDAVRRAQERGLLL